MPGEKRNAEKKNRTVAETEGAAVEATGEMKKKAQVM